MKRTSFPLLLAVLCLFACSSCSKKNQEIIPSAEFLPYISAYTGGVIPSNSSIRIVLTQEQEVIEMNSEVKEKLFTFSPSLKGKAYWVSSNTIEFIPEPGALKPGTLYNASFALDKVMDVEKHLKKFEFSFRVQERNFAAKVRFFDVKEGSPDKVSIRGELRFSETVAADRIVEMFKVKRNNESFTPTIETTNDPLIFNFTIADISKKEEMTELQIEISGKKLEIDKEEKEKIFIPARTMPFTLISAEIIDAPEHGVMLTFTDPVSDNQDLNGLILLAGVTNDDVQEMSNYVYQVVDNKINLFFERRNGVSEIKVYVDKGLKNSKNKSLTEESLFTLIENSLPPQVELLASGNILPNAKNLILPFKAVNLYAVDVTVIRIYESNVLMFLQENTLKSQSSSGLRRSGRLVYKKMLRLDDDVTKNIHEWENYAIDLSQLIKQEPGAIYRIELSFKQQYSAYPCGGEAPKWDVLTQIESNEMTEEEEAAWDRPNSYYYDDWDMDWEGYNWRERDNPCHATYYMESNRKAVINLLSSNIGVIAKANTNNKLWVSVADLLNAKPIDKADVTVYNYQLQPIGTAKTDANGFVEIQAKNKPFVLKVTSGDQKAYLRLVDGEENMLSRFDVGGKEMQKGLKGFIYGERGVWRPGDTLFISFMLEDREQKIPANHPVSIEVYNARGQFHYKQIATNGLNKVYTFAVPTKDDDPTGLWNAYVKVGGTSFHKPLRVETIKPNRLKINLNIPENRLDAAALQMPVTIHATWLTGATARNLKTKVEMTLSKSNTQFKGYENYIFNNPASDFSSTTLNLFEGRLNEQGTTTFNMKLPQAKGAPGMLRATVSCNVYEQGGDMSMFNQQVPYSPFEAYVGINFNQKGKFDYLETDKEHVFDIVTLNAGGKPVNRSGLEYKIYKLGWSWWWEHDNESYSSYLQNSSIEPVATGTLNTVNGKGQVKFKVDYPEWGRYLVFVKDSKSGHATGGTIFVDWPDWRGRSNRSDPNGIKMLTFSTDKSSYEVGETVTVMIPQSTGGRALVALENGSAVIHRDWVEMAGSGDTKYTFKITENMAPNIYVHISLLQPHEQTVNDLPIRMYGVVPVFVSNKASILAPQISMPNVLRPEEEFTVKVKETKGKPMTYTLAIVDEGLLDLTNFKTPDPWNAFYSREALGIRTWDMYDMVIGAFAGKYGSLFSIGGDEGINPKNNKASRFTPVVRFIGPFELKAGAEKSHKIKLPPYIGSVRVMVVAGQDGAYGNAEKTVPVKTPLMVLASLPRVAAIDEEIELPVTLFAMENTVKNVTVKVETTGKLKLKDKSSKTMSFSKPGDAMLYFTLQSGMQTGVETITVTATGNGQTSKQKIEIEVRNPNPPIISSQSALLNAGESTVLQYAVDGSYNENWVKLEVSRIPAVDISRRFDFLYNYPHYCSEQLVSRALPLLFISQFKDVDNKESEQIKKNVREAINNLYGRQLSGGGIVYWPGDRYVNEWITSYAGVFLALAKEKGYQVNEGVLKRWVAYQRREAQNWRNGRNTQSRYYYAQSDFEQAFRLYSLALAGSPEVGAMNRLKENKEISAQAKWSLAAAYALINKTKAAEELIANIATDITPYSLSNSTYGSSDRDEALILETLVLMGKDKEAFAQAQKVSRNLSRENHFTTQSTAYALMAMGRLAEKVAGNIDFAWTLNGQQQSAIKSAKSIFQKELPTKPSNGELTLKNNGKGLLYVNVVSKTKPLRDSLPVVQNNIRMEVQYKDMTGATIDITRLKQGTDFVAEIKISNISGTDSYTDLELSQIIPSGWEIYNERMLNPDEEQGASQQSYIYQDIRDDRVLTYFDLAKNQSKTFKIRLMASYSGSFILPAIHCSGMYDAGVQARTCAGRVSVGD